MSKKGQNLVSMLTDGILMAPYRRTWYAEYSRRRRGVLSIVSPAALVWECESNSRGYNLRKGFHIDK